MNTVQAATHQNVKASPNQQLVSGVGEPTVSIKQPKEGHPKIPGYTVTEDQPDEVVPAKAATKHELKTQHTDKDYNALAKRMDAEIEKLKSHRGLMSEMHKLASEQGIDVAAAAWKKGIKGLQKKFHKGKEFDMSKCISSMEDEGIKDPAAFCKWLSQQ